MRQKERTAKSGYKWSEVLVSSAIFVCLYAVLMNLGSDAARGNFQSTYLCKGDMAALSQATQQFRSEQGHRPRDVRDLVAYLKRQERRIGSAPFYHARNYLYGTPRDGKPANPLCWDSAPHGQPHTLLRFLNAPYRNVLLADGTIRQVPEAQFQAMELYGLPVMQDKHLLPSP